MKVQCPVLLSVSHLRAFSARHYHLIAVFPWQYRQAREKYCSLWNHFRTATEGLVTAILGRALSLNTLFDYRSAAPVFNHAPRTGGRREERVVSVCPRFIFSWKKFRCLSPAPPPHHCRNESPPLSCWCAHLPHYFVLIKNARRHFVPHHLFLASPIQNFITILFFNIFWSK